MYTLKDVRTLAAKVDPDEKAQRVQGRKRGGWDSELRLAGGRVRDSSG